jgi:hypothetical protein
MGSEWRRQHANGMVTRVTARFHSGEYRFSACAVREGEAASMRADVTGPLEHVQTVADADSGCPQPCTCPPWVVYK